MNCFFCSNLLLIHSKNAYPTPLSSQRCYGCGILIKDCGDFYYCSTTSHQTYAICSDCRLCKKAHFMQKCVNLSKINPLYHNNTFGCDVCGKTKATTDNGIWHCTQCNYDVCEECLP